MKFYRKITGERLYLSPFDPHDPEMHAVWAEWMNDRETADFYGRHYDCITKASAKTVVEGLTGHRFSVVLLDGDVLIGHVSLHDISHIDRNAFFGICIGEKKHRGKGYGTEALKLLLDYGFNTLNLNNIMLSVTENNRAAVSCYKKLGFKDAGRRREWMYIDGKYVDKLYMDMLAREFNMV